MSSLINTAGEELHSYVTSEACLQRVYSLLYSEEKQIKHFTYGLVSDIGKKYNIEHCVEKFIQGVAQTIDSKILTSLSNGLTCLTDLMITYPSSTSRHVADVMERVVTTLKKERVLFYVFS